MFSACAFIVFAHCVRSGYGVWTVCRWFSIRLPSELPIFIHSSTPFPPNAAAKWPQTAAWTHVQRPAHLCRVRQSKNVLELSVSSCKPIIHRKTTETYTITHVFNFFCCVACDCGACVQLCVSRGDTCHSIRSASHSISIEKYLFFFFRYRILFLLNCDNYPPIGFVPK